MRKAEGIIKTAGYKQTEKEESNAEKRASGIIEGVGHRNPNRGGNRLLPPPGGKKLPLRHRFDGRPVEGGMSGRALDRRLAGLAVRENRHLHQRRSLPPLGPRPLRIARLWIR